MTDKNKDQNLVETDTDWLEEYEGQLAIDVHQTPDAVVIKAPIAGVKPDDLDISINDEVVTIKGHRKVSDEIEKDNYFVQECYWGAFSRSYVLPVAVDPSGAQAKLKDGILTLIIPKQERTRTHKLQITPE